MIGAAVVINEVDFKRWGSQLLPELLRFGVGVGWVLDHCSDETKKEVEQFPGTKHITQKDGRDEVFRERWRDFSCDGLRDLGYKWVILWDADDTFIEKAPEVFRKTLENETRPAGYVRRASIWEKDGKLWVRNDGPFSPTGNGTQTNRQIVYNLDYEFRRYDNVTHGPHTFKNGVNVPDTFQIETYSIHWGLMDEELRKSHKVRWDENYTSAIGRNPYGLWDYVLDEQFVPELEPYEEWLKKVS